MKQGSFNGSERKLVQVMIGSEMVTIISAKNGYFQRHSVKDSKLSQSKCLWKWVIEKRTEVNIIESTTPGS